MTLERADASYTAWDRAIVAKSKRTGPEVQARTAVNRPEDTRSARSSSQAPESFRNALHSSDNHERHYDVTWRSTAAATGTGPTAQDPKNEDFGFWDFVDIINPLQHIPVVSTIYRELTGDEISAPARIMGGALYGGPLGFAASIGNAIVEEVTGKDAGEIAMAMVFEDESSGVGSEGTVLADASDKMPGPMLVNAGAAPEPRQIESSAATTVNMPETPRNAGQTAVLQEMSGNAALQDLLKEMGLAPNRPAATPAVALANQAVPAKIVQSVTEPAKTISPELAGRQSATQSSGASDGRQTQAETQAQAVAPRRSIPIDTSRYINPKAATVSKPSATDSETTVSDPQVEVAAKPAPTHLADTPLGKTSDKEALQASFADRMLQALDRYQAMSEQKTSLPSVNQAGQGAARPGAI